MHPIIIKRYGDQERVYPIVNPQNFEQGLVKLGYLGFRRAEQHQAFPDMSCSPIIRESSHNNVSQVKVHPLRHLCVFQEQQFSGPQNERIVSGFVA